MYYYAWRLVAGHKRKRFVARSVSCALAVPVHNDPQRSLCSLLVDDGKFRSVKCGRVDALQSEEDMPLGQANPTIIDDCAGVVAVIVLRDVHGRVVASSGVE